MSAAVAPDRPLVVVTGATGFLGSHIVDALLARGRRVRAVVRATSNLRWLAGKPVETVVAAAGDDDARRLLAGASAVIHCAGVTSAPDEAAYRAGNEAPVRRFAAAAADTPGLSAFVLISSLAAGGPAAVGRPRRESDPDAPADAYGRSKLAGEAPLAGELPYRVAVLRPPALYGPRDAAFLPLFVWGRRGLAPGLRGGLREVSLLDGRDCAAAAVALVDTQGARGAYYVEDGHAYGWDGIAEALGGALGRRVRTAALPLDLLRLAARAALLHPDRLARMATPAWTCDGARLRAETGWRAERDLARGFRETLAFYREAGWL